MTMRKKFLAGNWKMYLNAATAESLAAAVVKAHGNDTRARVALCPPFPYLSRVNQVLRDTMVALGAQNAYPETEGAFTGELSPAILTDVVCQHDIVWNSASRKIFVDHDTHINRVRHAAL